jgi:hypothetical protein
LDKIRRSADGKRNNFALLIKNKIPPNAQYFCFLDDVIDCPYREGWKWKDEYHVGQRLGMVMKI